MNMRVLLLRFAAAIGLAATLATATGGSAGAAITPGIEARASTLMKQGKSGAAYALLRRHHNPSSTNAQRWFILGVAAYRSGDLNNAERAFRRVLALDRNAPRAKLELARVLHRKGKTAESEQLFREVRALNPPARVAANIDRFLAMMQNRDAKGHAYRARASVGVGYDNNVNQVTDSRLVTLFGLPFLLNRDARQRGSGFAFFKAEFDHIFRFNRQFAWATSVSFQARKFFAAGDFDSYAVTAATGPVFQPGNRTTIMVPVFVNIRRFENSALGSGKRFYSNEFGIAPQIRYALSRSLTVNLATVFSRRHFFEQQGRSANVFRAVLGYSVKLNGANTVSLSAIYGRSLARQSIYSNYSFGSQASWQIAFGRNFVVALRGSTEAVRYDAKEAIYSAIRRDQRTTVGVNAIYKSELLKGDILFSYAHSWNQSNLAIFDSERDVLSIAYRKAF